MVWSDRYQLAKLAGSPTDGRSARTNLFNKITLKWSEPLEWPSGQIRPTGLPKELQGKKGFYAILRDHGRQIDANKIRYIGIAASLYHRLNRHYHPTASVLSAKRGTTRLSYAVVVGSGRHTVSKLKEIEDILIWANRDTIVNKSCMNTLPSMRSTTGKGGKRSRPWVITNTGFDFGGQMPAEIIYPWMLVRRPD